MKVSFKILSLIFMSAILTAGLQRTLAHGSASSDVQNRQASPQTPQAAGQESSVRTNEPALTARFVPDTVLIGDQYYLEVQVEKDIMQVVEFAEFPAGTIAGDMEILKTIGPDTLSHDGRNVVISMKYLLTCFESGIYRTEPLPALYLDKNITDTIWSRDSLQVVVKTFNIDTLTQTIHDIKLPMRTPVKFGEFSGYLFGGLALLALLIAGYIYMRKKLRKRPTRELPTPDRPAHVIAIERLEQLNSQKLWQSGKFKQYYTGITDILREYIEQRYGMPAMEMTSSEILAGLKDDLTDQVSTGRLTDVMLTADLVKFAKYTPDPDKNEKIYFEAYYFVEETKELPVEVSAPQEGGSDES